MSAFIRRFTFDPGDDILLDIESVNVLDLDPPSPINGVGTGTVCLVAEFEDGDFNSPLEVMSPSDVKSNFGGFGYTYNGDPANNPCARSRKADGALNAEYWNGNGAIALNAKKFYRLILVRVNTSVGEVSFTRLANLTGVAAFTYNLIATGKTFIIDSGSGNHTVNLTGVAATVTGSAGTFSMASGDQVVLGYDDEPNFTVTFLASDTTVTADVARINAAAGFTFATVSSGQIKLTGRVAGLAGEVRVVSGSTGVLTKLGLTAANTPGTGTTNNINAVTIEELDTLVNAADAAVHVETLADGTPRIYSTTGQLEIDSSTTATMFGFPTGSVVLDTDGTPGVIPAGTRISDGTTHFVTMQTIAVTAASKGPYTVPVRHATDDGTGVGATAGSVTTVEYPIQLDAFKVINLLAVSGAMSENQIDAAYQTAFDSTIDLANVVKETNIIYCARQSNAVRRALRLNALNASAGGMFGRICVIRPPLGTSKRVARSTTAEPGVGPYRDQRVIYTYPGVSMKLNAMAAKGISGGAGFTSDGVIDAGSDGFLVSLMSQLPPEENPGQETPFTTEILGLESSPNAAGYTIDDYKAFKRAGICAPILDSGLVTYQSGVTSVDPLANPGLKNIARRRMADFLQDTISIRLKQSVKKLNRKSRRTAIEADIRGFMRPMLGITNESQQRIGGFTLLTGTAAGNTPDRVARGMYRLVLNVRTLSSMDSIVLATTVGEGVTVEELAPGELK